MKKGKQTEAKKPTLLYIPQFTHLSVGWVDPAELEAAAAEDGEDATEEEAGA